MENPEAPAGVQESQPVPSSQEAAAQSSPVEASALEAQIRELQGQIRGLQGEKDKAVAKTNKRLAELERLASYLERNDGDKQRALREMRLDELLEAEQEPEGLSQQQPTGTRLPAAGVDSETLTVLGIDPRDPAVTEMLLQGRTALSDFIELAKQRAKQGPAAMPSTIQSVGVGVTSTPSAEQAQLRQEYERELAQTPRTAHAFAALKRKYQEKGLPIY